MKMLFFQQLGGRLAIMGLAVEPENFDSAGASVVAKGKFQAYVGAFSAGELPSHVDNLRFSAGALVVKLDIASERQWKILRREAQARLDATNSAAIEAIETGIPNPALFDYRNQLRAIIAAKPVELTAAANLSAIEAARPVVLDRPIPPR